MAQLQVGALTEECRAVVLSSPSKEARLLGFLLRLLRNYICNLRPYGCAADPFVAVLAVWWCCHLWLGWYSNQWFVVFDVCFVLVVD